VIAVIAATLFPLWPAEMRVGVYYLSVGAGCFVASILLLAVGKCRSSSVYLQVKSKRARHGLRLNRGPSGAAASLPSAVVVAVARRIPVRILLLATGRQSWAAERKRAHTCVTCSCFLYSVSCMAEISLLPLFKKKK